ncbi:hypothetical protein LOK49_LG12G03079 [Camellia lanceoleosa]|uniref:Uncharacterized protein n=1 Tax=Camellia lanceoleosa TaxID=1840588 RepID=A0ACC0FT51_9ERIC|nr:hypothetical protein LOK49_LG12G03079 [Camellia lanceoleosa]
MLKVKNKLAKTVVNAMMKVNTKSYSLLMVTKMSKGKGKGEGRWKINTISCYECFHCRWYSIMKFVALVSPLSDLLQLQQKLMAYSMLLVDMMEEITLKRLADAVT